MKIQVTYVAKSLWKKNKFAGLTLPEFKIYYKATVIKTVWYWPKDEPVCRSVEQRSMSSKINSCIYGELILDVDANTIQKKKDSFFFSFHFNKCGQDNWITTCQKKC